MVPKYMSVKVRNPHSISYMNHMYRGADKSLARRGRKQATATKLLTSASHSKKNSEGCPSNQVSMAAVTSTSNEKWRRFNCFFSRVGLRTYQHPCILKNFIALAREEVLHFHFSCIRCMNSGGEAYTLPRHIEKK